MNGLPDQLSGFLGQQLQNSGISPLLQMFSQSSAGQQTKQGLAPIQSVLQSVMQPSPQQADIYSKNSQFLQPGSAGFNTTLPPLVENQFRGWAGQNNIPIGNGTSEYDMRGLYQGLMNGHPKAQGFDPSSGMFPHFWTTPYSGSFSNQSQWAQPHAPAPSSNGWSP